MATPIEYINDCAPPVSGTTFLPDGSGVSYTTSILVDCFDSGMTITSANQLMNVCVTMEHSYSGDLDITIISPNGQEAQLFEQAGGGTYFGGANDDGTTTPGTGETYCFSMSGSVLLANAQTITNGSPPNNSWTPGTYLPYQSFNNLIGSPLNGTWTIEIVDNLAIDNGYIFEWWLEFDPNLQPPEYSFTPEIVSESWDPDPTIVSISGQDIVVQPDSDGTFCYTYRVIDDFGCEYEEEICVVVFPDIVVNEPIDLFTCETGAGAPYSFDLLSNDAIILAGNPSPSDYVISYYDSQANADSETNPLSGDLTAYSGVDNEEIFVRIEYLNTDCYETSSFFLRTIAQPVINPTLSLTLCDDQSNDGAELFDLDSQSASILGSQDPTDFLVTYYISQADADSATGAPTSPYLSGNASIYVRIDDVGGAGCFVVSNSSVFDLILLEADDSSFVLTPNCNGASATITGVVGGLFSFSIPPIDGAVIDPNTGLITNGSYGTTYEIAYTTNGVCPTTTIQTVTTLDAIDSSFAMSANCSGATAQILGATGGVFSFALTPTDGAMINSSTGEITNATSGATYSISYETVGSCPTITTVDVTVLAEEFATFSMTPTCDGGFATITGDTGGIFSFASTPTDSAVIDPTTGTITLGSFGTTYDVTYTTAGSCPASTTASVTVLAEEFSDFSMTPNCEGGIATILGDTGGTFAFVTTPTDGAVIDVVTGEVTGASPSSSYDISYTTAGPCPDVTTVTLTVLDEEFATFTMTPTCDGGVASITGTLGGVFSFASPPSDSAVIDPSTGTISGGSFSQTYTVVYTTTGPCPNTTSLDVTTYDEEFADFTMTPTCDGGFATITGDTGGIFTFASISTDSAVIDPTTGTITLGSFGTTYDVTYTTAGPCPASTTVSVTVLAEEFSDFNMTPNCEGGNASITGDVGGMFEFVTAPTDGATIDSATGEVTSGTPGASYQVSYTTSGPCPSVTVVTLILLAIDDPSFAMTPTCDGAIANVTGLVGGTFSFTVPPTDGAQIDVNTGLVTNAPFGNTYTVRYDTNGACVNYSEVTFTVYNQPIIFNPTPLEVCDDNLPDGIADFDLSVKNSEITGGNSNLLVTYHIDQTSADLGIGAFSIPYSGQHEQIVFVRVVDTTTGCASITTLQLIVNQAPAAVNPAPLIYCDPDNDGFGTFNLTDSQNEITAGDTTLNVTYHETMANAENSVDALTSPYDNIVQNTQVIYARVESSLITTGCATIVPLTLTVNSTPQIVSPTPLTQCDSDTDGFEIFDLMDKASEVLNGLDPIQYVLSFYLSQSDADEPTNAISSPGYFTNTISGNQIIWIRVDDTVNGCYKITTLELIVYPLPVLVQPTPLELCDDDVPDGLTEFDLTIKNNEITGGNGALVVDYYESQTDALGGLNPINPANAYINASVGGAPANPQTLYVRVEQPSTGCVSYTTLTLRVLPNPTPGLFPQDLELCDDFTPGDGQEIFDLTQNATYILNGESGVLLSYYESQQDAEQMINAIVDPTQYANTSSPQTIYVRDTNQSTGCYSIVSFAIMVHPLPEATPVTDYIVCELNTDQLYAFDLSSKDSEILNGQDPAMFEVSYYTTQANAQAGTNALLSPYTNTSNPQTIYAVITNTQTDCRILGMSFVIEVQESAQANPDAEPILYEVCDQTGANDGRAEFDLSTLDAEVLDGQNPANYAVSYHLSQADAQANVNPLSNPYSNTSNPQTIYARVSNVSTTTSICYATTSLELQVNLLPIFDLEPSYILCVNTNGTEVVGLPVMETGLSPVDYSFEWRFNNTVIAGSTGNSHTATQAGNYSVVVTNRTTLCENTDQTVVNSSEPPTLTAEVTSAAFSDNATIQAQVSGSGNYELSIDNGPWTTETLFTGLSEGIHEVWARDIIGCGQARVELLVIGYPPFFTPNGDGYNDTWNIFSLSDQLESKIRIFDRYGKLLKEIRPQSRGWDGTYNGELMPSCDYWFIVNYRDPNTDTVKQYKAHFTLKR